MSLLNDSTNTDRDILSVQQLNQQAKRLLQTHFSKVWVSGEISNFSQPASGHWYFTLKDNNAQIRCAMFKGKNFMLRFRPKEGDQVLIRGQISIYETRGDYQLIAEHMEAEGEGRLRQAFEELKKKLFQQGLFEQEHKQALPSYPQHIGVITSSTGAAVHDICSVLKRRWPLCMISIFATRVQGQEAPAEIIRAINAANSYQDSKKPKIDCLIVGRGGGSLEDLQAFNDEQLAYTIFESRLPIISAVGHEVDFSISDFVADARAPTPSAAAELISPDQDDLLQLFDQYESALISTLKQSIAQKQQAYLSLRRAMTHPREKIASHKQRQQHLLQLLQHAMQSSLAEKKQHSKETINDFVNAQPDIESQKMDVQDLLIKLKQSIKLFTESKQNSLKQNASLLNAVSPLATLSRGYAIVNDSDNKHIIHDISHIEIGNIVNTRLSNGEFESVVSKIKKSQSKPRSGK